jgi:ribonuclease P protein component
MLPKKRRISGDEFKDVLKKGRSFYSENLSMRVLVDDQPTKSGARFSFVVSGKVAKKAHDRNRLRRQGYSVLRGYSPKRPCRGVIMAKKGSLKLEYADLAGEIESLLKKSGLL